MVPTLVLESVSLHPIHAVGFERFFTEELKMKKLVLALSAVAAFTAPALAADMAPRPYTKAPVAVAAPVPTWTGCYVGGGGGYGMWNQENTGYLDPGGIGFGNRLPVTSRTRITETVTTGGRGYFGTVQGGCDYQFAALGNQFVVGGFADYDFDSIKGNHNPPATDFWASEKMSQAWSVGGRIGWLAFPSLLTYFSAGYTEAKFDQQNYTNLNGPPFGVAANVYTAGRTYQGWFLGAGDEYALNFLPGLFWKTEYRVSEFNRVTNPVLSTTTNLPTGYSEDSKKWVQTIRSELVYRFNWGAPLVAKY
jgi:outer membrane immunogenic protein